MEFVSLHLPCANLLTQTPVSVFPAITVTIWLRMDPARFQAPSTPPLLIPDAHHGPMVSAALVPATGHSTLTTSALLSLTNARPTKDWTAPAATMDTFLSTDLASFPLRTPSPPMPAALNGIGPPRPVSPAQSTGSSPTESASPFPLSARLTIAPTETA